MLSAEFKDTERIRSANPTCAKALPLLIYFLENFESINKTRYLIRIKLLKNIPPISHHSYFLMKKIVIIERIVVTTIRNEEDFKISSDLTFLDHFE